MPRCSGYGESSQYRLASSKIEELCRVLQVTQILQQSENLRQRNNVSFSQCLLAKKPSNHISVRLFTMVPLQFKCHRIVPAIPRAKRLRLDWGGKRYCIQDLQDSPHMCNLFPHHSLSVYRNNSINRKLIWIKQVRWWWYILRRPQRIFHLSKQYLWSNPDDYDYHYPYLGASRRIDQWIVSRLKNCILIRDSSNRLQILWVA